MKSIKTTGMCLGAIRLAGIDMGFDIRLQGPVLLPEGEDWDRLMSTVGSGDQTGVGYDSPEGRRLAWGTRDEICKELARCGYTIIAARTPNGRDVRCEPTKPTVFVCQPPNDNFWNEFPTIAEALAQWVK
jgi:hypothetical protein